MSPDSRLDLETQRPQSGRNQRSRPFLLARDLRVPMDVTTHLDEFPADALQPATDPLDERGVLRMRGADARDQGEAGEEYCVRYVVGTVHRRSSCELPSRLRRANEETPLDDWSSSRTRPGLFPDSAT
jgi:hypothetical protein